MSCQSNNVFKIIRGNSFEAVIRWEGNQFLYKAITAIGQVAPVSITSVGHGVPDGWRVAIASVKGMTEINAENSPPKDDDFHQATKTSADVIALNDVNAADYCAYKSGGYIQYKEPVDMTDFTARMQFRTSASATDTIDEFTDADVRLPDTGIVIDNTNKKIILTIAASVTADYTFKTGVFSLEMISPAGVVTKILEGEVTSEIDVTR